MTDETQAPNFDLGSPLPWERIEGTDSNGDSGYHYWGTARLRVPGGWLVKSWNYVATFRQHRSPSGDIAATHGVGHGLGLTFVPDPDGKWVVP